MYKILKQNRFLILTFAIIVAAGIGAGVISRNISEQSTDLPSPFPPESSIQAPTTESVVGETVGATEAPDDFSERLWEPMPEPVPAVSVLQATQNDDKGDDDEKTETQTAETNVVAPGVVTSDVTASGGTDAADTTVEPDQPVAVPAVPAITETRGTIQAIQTETTAVESTPEIENEPTVTKPVPTEQEVASQPSAKKPEWIPFIYYYRQSMTMYGPVKTLYIVPFDPKMQSAPQVTPPPALRPRLYPVVLMPVFPVFLICH